MGYPRGSRAQILVLTASLAWLACEAVEPNARSAPPAAPDAKPFRFRLAGEIAAEDLAAVRRESQAAHRNVVRFLEGAFASPASIPYYVYPDSEQKGLLTGDTRTVHLDPDAPAIHASSGDDRRRLRAVETACLLVRSTLGEPATAALERGLAVYLSESDSAAPDWELWAARLHLAGETPPLGELLHPAAPESESELVNDPLAASFVSFLLESWGKERFLARYATASFAEPERGELEGGWRAHLDRRAARLRSTIESRRERFPAPRRGFQKGFTHAHEGYRIYNGYLSGRSDASLEKLAALGVGAVAIVPYTFMRNPNRPIPLPIPRRPGAETDEAVEHAIRTAKELGMTVMLKPQIWLRGSWPGDIEMRAAADREAFFEHYYRWIRHYALMAERNHVEILSLGVELTRMTAGQDAIWSRMAQRLRALYSGRLVYSANWDREIDQVGFWKDLDYVGVNFYFPLSPKEDPSDRELEQSLAGILSKLRSLSERHGRPLLITEIGFASTPAPWRRPHYDERDGPVSLADQARCYEIAFQALRESGSWIAGVYWWKWPSDLSRGGPLHSGFTPNGKPAERVVERYFGTSW